MTHIEEEREKYYLNYKLPSLIIEHKKTNNKQYLAAIVNIV